MSSFEERLLVELQTTISTAPVRRGRRRLVAVAGVAAVASAAIVGVLVLDGGTPAAYAVTKHADDSVTVEVDSLTDAAGLQAALAAAGVRAVVDYLPAGKMCKQPWFTPAERNVGLDSRTSVGPESGGGTTFTISGDRPADST
ncbi:MAG: hypothetical protein ABUS54_06215, partial [Actinomycetota bacterium]